MSRLSSKLRNGVRYRWLHLHRSLLLVMLVTGIADGESLSRSAFAQVDGGWSTPVALAEGLFRATEPFLVADSVGGVHLFWSGVADEDAGSAIYYRYRSSDGVWSTPVDILYNRGVSPRAVIDRAGYIHLVTGGASLFYSHAHHSEAASPWGWSPPIVLAGQTLAPDITLGDDGALRIVYAERGGDVYYMNSVDNGQTWSSPIAVSAVVGGDATDAPRLARDENGVLHVVWSQAKSPEGWPPTGVYYAQSRDDGATWTSPIPLAGLNQGIPDIAALDSSALVVVWFGTGQAAGKYFSWSTDGGRTWQPAECIAPEHTGLVMGHPKLVIDGSQNLHLLMSSTVNDHDDIFFGSWQKGAWSPLVMISAGLIGAGDMQFAEGAIGLGNQLHAVWSSGGQNGVWYSSRTLEAAAIPAAPLAAAPTKAAIPPPTHQAVDAANNTAPVGVELSSTIRPYMDSAKAPSRWSSPIMGVVLSAGIALSLIAIVIRFQLRR